MSIYIQVKLFLQYIGFQDSSRPSSISILNIFSLYILLNKNKQKFADFIKNVRELSNLVKLNFVGG